MQKTTHSHLVEWIFFDFALCRTKQSRGLFCEWLQWVDLREYDKQATERLYLLIKTAHQR